MIISVYYLDEKNKDQGCAPSGVHDCDYEYYHQVQLTARVPCSSTPNTKQIPTRPRGVT
jgi:hypothetical protein